ncbi:MAG: hypothetical protein A3G34_03075 [Candidatus Lindowbacteria bacterium RIFCSPLOWO2_12_FULL_62_27]|nr:MAG: hypothetical protein A3G34_03075 [Candidatus Lindowbacteria bacterium RIFCSPLOWO2_12_FULL_62_27]
MGAGIHGIDLYVFGAAAAAFVLFLVVHVIVFRYLRPRQLTLPLAFSFACGFMAACAGAWGLIGTAPIFPEYTIAARRLAGLSTPAVYSLLTLHYLSWVFGMGEAAVRIRILLELDKRPGGSATPAELRDAYSDETILKIRLAKLVGAGYLRESAGIYRISRSQMFLQAKAIGLLKRVLGVT